jgi:EF-P beta-lysylation protein EpmB
MRKSLPTQPTSVEATFGPSPGRPAETVLAASSPNASWSEALKTAVRSGRQLLELVGLPHELACTEAENDFSVMVPREYIQRMKIGDPNDPLLGQVLASRQELSGPEGLLDPVGDAEVQRVPGLLQKYRHRALLITSGACAVHCRYCFRRHYPYQTAPTGLSGWQAAVDEIARDTDLEEIILSGGDPLSVRDEVLSQLVDSLNQIGHISRIRIHTRLPVVIPQRVCPELLDWVSGSRAAIYFVLHFNHAAEIDQPVADALKRLRCGGATLLNQSVLLKGINDSLKAQKDLCRALINLQVLPYYLHQLDPVQGATHYGVSDLQAKEIVDGLRRELPGYAVPQLVREIAGRPSKVPL